MKNLLLGALACLVVALMFGYEPVLRIVNEYTNHGTVRGVERCMDYSSSELVSDDAVRTICISTFQKSLQRRSSASGSAGPRTAGSVTRWGGTLQNNTASNIITWVGISVSTYDADGDEQNYLGSTPIWIDPHEEIEFSVELPHAEPGQFDEIEFCDEGDLPFSECMAWDVIAVMGLGI